MLILGDAVHTRAQLENPDWAFRSDVDSRLATEHRTHLLCGRDIEATIAGGHFSNGVFGRAGRQTARNRFFR